MFFIKQIIYVLTILSLGISFTSATVDTGKKKKEFVKYEGGDSYQINEKGQIQIPLSYKVKKDRLIATSLRDSDGKWIVGGRSIVKKGTGKVLITLGYVGREVRTGMDYQIEFHIREIGDQFTWRDAIDHGLVKHISARRKFN